MTAARRAPSSEPTRAAGGVLVVRPDNLGDVLLSGPAVRAIAGSGSTVTMAVSPRGREVACRLPGVAQVVEVELPWIAAEPAPYDRCAHEALLASLSSAGAEEAVILTSFHQSALPTAALLRLAGVRRVTAISEDYPGSLLDVRVAPPGRIHEVERMLAVAAAAGFHLPPDDDASLRIVRDSAAGRPKRGEHVVVHPGASVPARTLSAGAWRQVVAALAEVSPVVVTGARAEADLVRAVVHGQPPDVRPGGTTTFDELAELLASARAVVAGNTGPAHLAAAVGTPVVSIFPPTVDPVAWRPWGVPHVLLGDLEVECAGCRSRVCPLPEQRCLSGITPGQVVAAVERLAADR